LYLPKKDAIIPASSTQGDIMSLEDQRREYQFGRLTRESLKDSPFDQFALWLEQALASDMVDPTAMGLATVDAAGNPWQRVVLLKRFDSQGFVFYTNLGSRKAREMAANANVSLLFPWLALERQVIASGVAERLPARDVVKYFLSRPRDSQLAAWASSQSSRISSRQALDAHLIKIRETFRQGETPVPDFWGGSRVVPS